MKNILFVALFACFTPINALAEVVCPSNITCEYESGTCNNSSEWQLDTGRAYDSFSGQSNMNLSSIVSYKESLTDPSPYSIRCYYSYGTHSVIGIYTYVKELVGTNWVFSGFGKNKADCSDVADPITCSAIK